MKEFQQIMSELKKGNYRPVYLLQGEEPYFIDVVSDYIIEHALDEFEKSFNLNILYGRDVNAATLIEYLRRLPMMGSRQVVVLREAQYMHTFKDLEVYLENPVSSTIFVINYKGKKVARNTRIYKHIAKHGAAMTTKQVYDNHMPAWIQGYLSGKGIKITPKASALLVEFLGNDLSKVVHGIDKIFVNNEDIKNITEKEVEEHIGISKDYNAFELGNSLMFRDAPKAFRIIRYFGNNPKAGPMPLVIASLYMIFSKLLLFHRYRPTGKEVASVLKVNPIFVKDYERGARQYNTTQLQMAIDIIAQYDLRAKGVNSADNSDGPLLQEMVYKILNL